MIYKSKYSFLPFCHNARVWRTDRQTDGQTESPSLDRVCIPCSAVKMSQSVLHCHRKPRSFHQSFSAWITRPASCTHNAHTAPSDCFCAPYKSAFTLSLHTNTHQNAAACLTTGTRRCERITPVLQKLHWLPVRPRVEFKLACLVHQSLTGQTPSYHSFRHSAHCRYWPLSTSICVWENVVFHAHTTASATEAFLLPAVGCGWNALPSNLWRDMNYRHFKHVLKGHMFRL